MMMQKPAPQYNNFQLLENKKIAELSERTRLLEERVKELRESLHVVDQTMQRRTKLLKDSINDLREEISNLRAQITELRSAIRRIINDLTNTARKSDVKLIEKYIELIDPTNIVTRKDVERIVEEKLREVK